MSLDFLVQDAYEESSGGEPRACSVFRELHPPRPAVKPSFDEGGEKRIEAALVRIAEAHGISSPLVLVSMAENDDENYAEILVRHIEEAQAKKEEDTVVSLSATERDELSNWLMEDEGLPFDTGEMRIDTVEDEGLKFTIRA